MSSGSTVGSTGPTTGAAEEDARAWHSSPVSAFAIRLAIFMLPLGMSLAVVRLVADSLLRPEGRLGLALWIFQAAAVGIVVSMAVDRVTKNLLPLAALFKVSLVFPDEAPSRFSVALRAGTARKLHAKATAVKPLTDAANANEAATAALALVSQLAIHDRQTRGHTERVRAYSDLIGVEMGLTAEERIRLSWAGLLHDVGKMTVPSEILNKRGRPDETEWAILSNHPGAGGTMLAPLADWLGEWVLAAAQHHERWDGQGYPLGLKGEEISLAGRIVAVADAYDVITSKRSYKSPMSREAARRELVACAGNQFDPDVVRAFLNVSLGRRWFFGPFAWLAELPLGQIGGAAARIPVAVAGGVVAVSATTIPVQLDEDTSDLAFDFDGSSSGSTSSTTSLPLFPSTTAPVVVTTGLQDLAPLPDAIGTGSAPETTVATTAVVTNPATSPTSTPGGAPPSIASTTIPAYRLALPVPPLPPPPTSTTSVVTSTSPTTSTTTPTTTSTTTPTTSTSAGPPGSPVLVADSIEVKNNRQINVRVLDNDESGNAAFNEDSLEIVVDPLHATKIEIHNDHVHYKSDKNYSGIDTFTYRVCNDNGLCSVQTVVVTVT